MPKCRKSSNICLNLDWGISEVPQLTSVSNPELAGESWKSKAPSLTDSTACISELPTECTECVVHTEVKVERHFLYSFSDCIKIPNTVLLNSDRLV